MRPCAWPRCRGRVSWPSCAGYCWDWDNARSAAFGGGARAAPRQAPGNAELRESTAAPACTPSRRRPPAKPRPAEKRARQIGASREWGVPPLEPLSIRTADFERVPALDQPMMARVRAASSCPWISDTGRGRACGADGEPAPHPELRDEPPVDDRRVIPAADAGRAMPQAAPQVAAAAAARAARTAIARPRPRRRLPTRANGRES